MKHCRQFTISTFYLFLIGILLLANFQSEAQHFKLSTYQVEQGLTTNMTKAIYQDKKGFMWIGTDVGLLRYDGYSFKHLHNKLSSPYIKLFFEKRNGDFFVVHDLGIDKIINSNDSVYFQKFLIGSHLLTDSALYYPKNVYEDHEGNLWISEMYSIVKYANGKIKRYMFDKKTNTSSFSRSFQCIEDGYGNFITFAQPGFVFVYDKSTDSFKELDIRLKSINGIIKLENGRLWLGTGDGIIELNTDEKANIISNTKVVDFHGISTIKIDTINQLVYIGTWINGLHKLSLRGEKKVVEKVDLLRYKVINDLYINSLGEVWVSSDEGLALLYLTFFAKTNIANDQPFIQTIKFHSNGKIYITNGTAIWEVSTNKDSYSSKELFVLLEDELILSITLRNNKLYFGTAKNNLFTLNLNTLEITKKDMSAYGTTIFSLKTDHKNDVWLCQQDSKYVVKIDTNENFKFYGNKEGILNNIYAINEHKNILYCAGNGENSYLYKYDETNDRFINLSQPLHFEVSNDFGVQDLAINAKGEYFLGTNSYGLLKLNNDEKIERINLHQKEELTNIKSLLITKNDELWIGSDRGLLLFYNDQIQLFDETNGLPSNTISYRSLALDSMDHFWVGTANGASQTQRKINFIRKTPTPILLSLKMNGEKIHLTNDKIKNTFINNSYLYASFVSLIYPSKNIVYQYRLVGKYEKWSAVNHNEITIPQLDKGNYKLEIRACKQGEYLWSDPLVFEFNIEEAWYLKWWSILIFLILTVTIVWAIVKWNTIRLLKLKQKLESIIQNRTAEINKQKEEITLQKNAIEKKSHELEIAFNEIKALNTTKDRFFSIIAHDLRGPLFSLSSFSALLVEGYLGPDDVMKVGKQLNQAVKNTLDLTENLLTWARSQMNQSSFQPEFIDLNHSISESIKVLQSIADSKNIALNFTYATSLNVWVDKDQLDFVVRNLISNALKFTHAKGKIDVLTQLNQADEAEIIVQDSGVGISETVLEKIFKIDSNHSTKGTNGEKGTGLGLSLCQDFVNKNGGKIWVESKVGEGSKFHFTLKTIKPDEV